MENKIFEIYKNIMHVVTSYHLNDESEEKQELLEISDDLMKIIRE